MGMFILVNTCNSFHHLAMKILTDVYKPTKIYLYPFSSANRVMNKICGFELLNRFPESKCIHINSIASSHITREFKMIISSWKAVYPNKMLIELIYRGSSIKLGPSHAMLTCSLGEVIHNCSPCYEPSGVSNMDHCARVGNPCMHKNMAIHIILLSF